MNAEELLQRLSNVRKTGVNKFQACCPAHNDLRPSLAIKELDDGRVLLHCFAGCSVIDVLDSLGLTFNDLYPQYPPDSHVIKRDRKPWSANDVLQALAFEVLLVWNYAENLSSGTSFNNADQERLLLAASRLLSGVEIIKYG